MLKLKHYFKKFWAPILLCVGLLFMQSQSELALPDYMSDIVSVGIQAGGFDSAVSDVLSEETFNHLLVLLNEDDQTILEDSYQLVTSKDIDQDLLDKFSKAKGKNLYELKELDDEEMDQLEDILIKPMLLITSIDSMDPNSKEYQEQFGSLPAGMSPYDAIGMMPQDQKDKMFEKCLFLSPILDMNYLIQNMFLWFDVCESELKEKGEIETPIETLSWNYYQFVKNNPVKQWITPTYIMYGYRDTLQSEKVIHQFVKNFNCQLTISKDSEHSFMGDTDRNILQNWIKEYI